MGAPESRASIFGGVGAPNEDELEWIYHYAPIGLCQLDLELRFLRINASLAEINGIEPAAHIGRTVRELLPSLAPTAEHIARKILSTGMPVLDHEFSGETPACPGVTRYWKESWHPVLGRDGRIRGFGVVAEEITERKKAEQALRDLLVKYELVVSGAGDAIWVWDVVNHRVDYSSRWKQLHGFGEEDIGDSEAIWIDSIHPDDLERVMDAVQAHFDGASQIFQEEYRVLRKDGRKIWVQDRGVAMRDAQGRVTRMAGSERDITQHKIAEEKLRDSARRKDDFLAMLAHELRNPLAPIQNGLHVLERHEDLPPAVKKVLPMMSRQVRNLIRLVDDLLDIARIQRGKIELKKAPCDLVEILRSAIETAEPHIVASNQTIELDVPAGPLFHVGDPARLTQVFANLINNASKFTDAGGHIWVTAQKSNGEAAIRVRDDGCGIDPKTATRIFEPFMQGDLAARSHGLHQGLGVGLALSKRLVDMHGGSIDAHSDGPGKGAEFTIRLPLQQPNA